MQCRLLQYSSWSPLACSCSYYVHMATDAGQCVLLVIWSHTMRTICIRFRNNNIEEHNSLANLRHLPSIPIQFICPSSAPERVEPGGAEEEPGGGKEAAIAGEMAIKLNIPRNTFIEKEICPSQKPTLIIVTTTINLNMLTTTRARTPTGVSRTGTSCLRQKIGPENSYRGRPAQAGFWWVLRQDFSGSKNIMKSGETHPLFL